MHNREIITHSDWQAVMERDGYRCTSCGRANYEVALEVDHIAPRAAGGSNRLENLRLLCVDCHRARHGGQRRWTWQDVQEIERQREERAERQWRTHCINNESRPGGLDAGTLEWDGCIWK